MSWFDKVLDAVQTAAVIGERVERLGRAVGDLAFELRDLDRRVAASKAAWLRAAHGAHRLNQVRCRRRAADDLRASPPESHPIGVQCCQSSRRRAVRRSALALAVTPSPPQSGTGTV
jgi:hypothetical protein